MSKAQIFERLKKLATALGSEIDQDMLKIYTEAISHYPLEKVKTAINQAFLTCHKFPAPVVMIELIEPTKSEATILTEKILKAAIQYGTYQHEKAKKSIGERDWALIESLGGWGYICGMHESQIPFLKNKVQEMLLARREQRQKEILDHNKKTVTNETIPLPLLK